MLLLEYFAEKGIKGSYGKLSAKLLNFRSAAGGGPIACLTLKTTRRPRKRGCCCNPAVAIKSKKSAIFEDEPVSDDGEATRIDEILVDEKCQSRQCSRQLKE